MQEALKLKEDERKALAEQVDTYVRSIPDFPEPGIIFRDVTTVIQDADGLVTSVEAMEKVLRLMQSTKSSH